jgi:hypothetical protein
MQRRPLFLVLATVGALLLATPFVYQRVVGASDPIEPSVAEYFPVQDRETGMWGFVDREGKPLTHAVFDWAGDFRQGRGLAELDGAMGYIDEDYEQTGKWAIYPRFVINDPGDMAAYGFFDGRALARNSDGLWGYLDRDGEWAIEPVMPEARDYPGVPAGDFSEGLAWFQLVEMRERNAVDDLGNAKRDAEDNLIKESYARRTIGYMNRDGKVVIEPKYQMGHDFGEGLAGVRVRSQGSWGFIDRDGRQVIRPQFEAAGVFADGLCPVKRSGRWGYIDTDGEEVIAYQFDEARSFSEGLAAARLGDRWGYINTSGQWAIEPVFDDFDAYAHPGEPRAFENGLARVTLQGETIYIDSSGRQIWPRD